MDVSNPQVVLSPGRVTHTLPPGSAQPDAQVERECGQEGTKMHCPFCRHPDSRVVDSREDEDGAAISRRRQCRECGERFTTLETASLTVTKRSGATEPFSRDKVIAGVRKAIGGRPVDEDALALLAQQVEEAVRAGGAAPVPAHDIGMAVLGPLRALDEVAYLRFASVYRGFDSLADFEAEISALRSVGPGDPGAGHRVDHFGPTHHPAPPSAPLVPARA